MKEAFIEETATVLKNVHNTMPSYDDAMVNPPGVTMPRLRCYLFFKEEGQAPNKPDLMQPLGGCLPNLRMWCNMDKEYSRQTSMRAIPELLNEINVRRDPQMAEKRFKNLIMEPYVASAFMDAAKAGNAEPYERQLDRMRSWTNVGSGS